MMLLHEDALSDLNERRIHQFYTLTVPQGLQAFGVCTITPFFQTRNIDFEEHRAALVQESVASLFLFEQISQQQFYSAEKPRVSK